MNLQKEWYTSSTSASFGGGGSIDIEPSASINANGSLSVENQVDRNQTSSIERVNETTVRISESYKMNHQVKVVETHENESENRTTRVLTNPNMGQVLVFKHYGLDEVYSVTTQKDKENEYCLMIKNPDLGKFDLDFVLAFEDRLRRSLLSKNYAPGIEAAKMLAAQRWFDRRSTLKAELEEVNRQNRLAAASVEPSSSTQAIEMRGVFASAKKVQVILETFLRVEAEAGTILEIFAAPLIAPFDPDIDMPTVAQVEDAADKIRLLSYWIKLKHVYPGFSKKAEQYIENLETYDFDDVANKDEIVLQLSYLTDVFGENWTYHVKMVGVAVIIAAVTLLIVSPSLLLFFGTLIVPAITPLFLIDSNNGLPEAMEDALQNITAYQFNQAGSTLGTMDTSMSNGETEGNIGITPSELAQVPRLYDDKELAEAHADFEKLVLHLGANKIYYQNEIWRHEQPSDRLYRLEIIGVAPFVSNRIIGFSGSSMALPLRIGTFSDEMQKAIKDSVPVETGTDISHTEEIKIPTSGIRAITILEPCNTLEPHIVRRRAIDEKHRTAQMESAEAQTRKALAEAKRREKRIDHDPPILSSFDYDSAPQNES